MFMWMVDVDFGIDFSNQTRSSKVRDVFRLVLSDSMGIMRWIIDGK